MTARDQWVGWRWEWRADGKGCWSKIPLNPRTRARAATDDPSTWGTFDEAWTFYQANLPDVAGIGFVFSKADPDRPNLPDDEFTGVDFDDAIDPDTGAVREWAEPLVNLLATYTEVSPSLTGVKAFLRGRKLVGWNCRKKYQGGEVEMYDRGRFFVVTGRGVPGTPETTEARQKQMEQVYRTVFGGDKAESNGTTVAASPPPAAGGALTQGAPTVTPSDGYVPTSEEVCQRIARTKSADKFDRLWRGDLTDFNGDESRADYWMVGLLAYYYGPHPNLIDAEFRRCALFRAKWDELRGKQTYGERTIAKILATKAKFATWTRRQPARSCNVGQSGERNGTVRGEGTGGGDIHQTDLGNARRLVEAFGAGLLYCHPWEQWFVWDGRRWRVDNTAEVMRLAKRTICRLFADAADLVQNIQQQLNESIRQEVQQA